MNIYLNGLMIELMPEASDFYRKCCKGAFDPYGIAPSLDH